MINTYQFYYRSNTHCEYTKIHHYFTTERICQRILSRPHFIIYSCMYSKLYTMYYKISISVKFRSLFYFITKHSLYCVWYIKLTTGRTLNNRATVGWSEVVKGRQFVQSTVNNN
jgi:hypothetical protein